MYKISNLSELNIIKKIGEGGQGSVYIVELNKRKYAMKLLVDFKGNPIKYSHEIAKNIDTLTKMDSPSDLFVWPKCCIEYDGQFGYLMELVDSDYKELTLYLNAHKDCEINSITTLIDICINILVAFNKLRLIGYSYQDINSGNIFINPKNGKIKILDCDNICPTNNNYGVSGRKGFQAPEVILGSCPNIYSDIFSITLVMYYLLCKDNPFEGKLTNSYTLMTPNDELELFGKNPVFTYHPTDKRNRPDKNLQQGSYYLWNTLPPYIKEAFVKTFTEGIKDVQNGRVGLNEWMDRLLKYKSSLVNCNSCGEEVVVFKDKDSYCDNCYKLIKNEVFLTINQYEIPLFAGNNLYNYHLGNKKDNMDKVIGQVLANKKYPNILGLRNMSDSLWKVINAKGETRIVTNEETLVITKGTKIIFSSYVQGKIK